MAELEQMPRRELPTASVVDGNRAELAVAAAAVEQHDERAAVTQRLEMTNAAGSGSDNDALHPLFFEQPKVPGLALRRPVGGAHDDSASLLVHGVLEAADRLGSKRVRGVENDGAEAAALAAAHLMGRRAADESDPVDHFRSTRASVSGATISGRFSTFEAVPSETPACSATSRMVTRTEAGWRRSPSAV